MVKIEIVSHCFNYSRLLAYQLSSLTLHPPNNASIIATVFYCREDAKTVATLDWFTDFAPRKQNNIESVVQFRWWPLDQKQLMRRAIGRDMACQNTSADILWFADCDYYFGPDCLSTLADLYPTLPPDSPLFFPRQTLRSRSHVLGDIAISRIYEPAVYHVNADEYEPEINKRAIGGIQIARGDVCRQVGYCRGHKKWQKPAGVWKRTYEDREFRKRLGTPGHAIDLPNLYRIRHSKRGRFDIGVEL